MYTVGDLRAIIADLPDDMEIAVHNDRVESFVEFDIDVGEDDDGIECLRVWAD